MVNQAVLNLSSQPAFSGLSDAEAATAANALTVRKTDSSLKNSRAMMQRVGVDKAQQLYSAIGQAGYTIVQGAFDGDGIDFSSPQTQGMIDSLVLAQSFSAKDGAVLKAVGAWFISPYAEAGGSGTATAEDFAVARKYEALRTHLRVRYNAAVDGIENGDFADLAALKAFLGA